MTALDGAQPGAAVSAAWPRLLTERRNLVLFGLLLALAAVAWVATQARMEGMDDGPGLMPMALAFFAGSWTLMMAAMMLPSLAPTVLTYEGMRRGRVRRGETLPPVATALLVVGYLAIRARAGIAAWLAYEGVRDLWPSTFGWDDAGRPIAVATFALAAIYEVTPLKWACLRHCRSPLMFLAEHWHGGRLGALRIGAAHGAWCLGCCWALMAALFALGVMDVGWMAAVAAIIAFEKLFPSAPVARGLTAAILLALAVAVAVDPHAVPGLLESAPATPEPAMDGMLMR